MNRTPFDLAGLPSRRFRPRIYGVGAWTEHIFFAYDLVAEERPDLLVELGTDRGESYFSFCQSVVENQTGTRCFAVDTWKGDAQSGLYGEITFQDVESHNRMHYKGFSTLLRQTFDEAVSGFQDGKIDILHLDGFHSEEAVRHDLANWLPKISPGGILLLHDVNVRAPGFGVWRVWEDLKHRGRAFTFDDGPGLGVWEQPPERDSALRSELFGAEKELSTALSDHYRARVQELQKQIATDWESGAIKQSALARETLIQIFYSSDGTHREADSVVVRIGHDGWKDISITLPTNARAEPLRIDFVSTLHIVEIARLRVVCSSEIYFDATDSAAFDRIDIRGDAERLPDSALLRLKITGIDPQLYLPPIAIAASAEPLVVEMKLRVQTRMQGGN